MKWFFHAFSVLSMCFFAAGCGGTRTALGEAVYARDVTRAKSALDAGASPNEVAVCGAETWQYTTPLVCAIYRDSPEAVRLLVERGADINRITPFGDTPLIAAAWSEIKNSFEITRILLDKKALVNRTGNNWVPGKSALMEAAAEGKADVVKLLLEHGAEIDAKTSQGLTPLIFAARYQRANVAKILIAKGADLDYAIEKTDSGGTEEEKEEYRAAARLLKELKETYRPCAANYRPDAAMLAAFPETVAKYRAMAGKKELPEDARVFRVQAEDAVARKRFQEAVELYGKALRVAPWWPEGHFNQALILGENDCPEEAIAAMERYLALVPDAPDARAARDQVYKWKGRLP